MHILYSCKAWIEYIYTVHVVCQSQQTKTIFCCIIKLKFIIDQFQLAAVKTLYIHTHNLVLPLPTIHLLRLVLYMLSVQGNSLTIDTSNNSLRTDWVMIGYTHNKHSMTERERESVCMSSGLQSVRHSILSGPSLPLSDQLISCSDILLFIDIYYYYHYHWPLLQYENK